MKQELKLLISIIMAIFLTELGLMLFLKTYQFSFAVEIIIDSFMLVLILFPMFYFSMYRPLLRKNAVHENTLKKMQILLRAMEQSPISITVMDINGYIESINPKFTAISGFTIDDVVAKPMSVFSNISKEELIKIIDTIRSGCEWVGELENKTKDGKVYWVTASVTGVEDESGKLINIVKIAQDITGLKKHTQDLARSNRVLRIQSALHSLLLDAKNEEKFLLDACQLAVEISGYSFVKINFFSKELNDKKELNDVAYFGNENGLNKDLLCWTGPNPIVKAISSKAFSVVGAAEELSDYSAWYKLINEHGFQSMIAYPLVIDSDAIGVFSLYSSRRNSFSADEIKLVGEVAGVISYGIKTIRTRVSLQDVGIRLQQNEELLRLVTDNMPGMVMYVDNEQIYRFSNPRHRYFLKRTGEQIIGKKVSDTLTAESYEGIKKYVEMALAGKEVSFETVMMIEGQLHYLDTVFVPSLTSNGEVRGYVGVVSDNTPRKMAEIALKNSKEGLEHDVLERTAALKEYSDLLSATFNAITESVFVMDSTGIVLSINETGAKRVHTTPAEITGKNIFGRVSKEVSARRLEWLKKIVDTGQSVHITDQRDGHWMDQSLYPVKDDNGRVSKIVVFAIDITERKHAEEALQESLAELGRANRELQDFVYVASHDLQEPLRKVIGFGGRLMDYAGPQLDERARDYLQRMVNASGRMQSLIDDLLSMARLVTRAKPFEMVSLQKVLHEVMEDMEIQIETSGAKIQAKNLLTIQADPTQMRQLIQNLIGNSIKYRRPDVTLVIQILTTTNTALTKIGGHEFLPGELCILQLEDNGIGFESKYAEKIFGMFQRLHGREEYTGTGVGLTICKKIIERHGGTISATGILGQGATFTVQLPMKQEQKEKEKILNG